MKIKLTVLVLAAALILSACGSAAPQTSPEATTPAETVEPIATEVPSEDTDAAQTEDGVNVNTLMELMGKKDADLVATIGEGTPMYNDEKVLIDREYALDLFGEKVTANISLNMYAYGEDTAEMCTIHLNNAKLDEYRDQLTAELGEPTEATDKSYKYETDTLVVVLANPYDLPYIEITIK